MDSAHHGAHAASDGLLAFIGLAWGTTWALCLPLVLTSARGLPPHPILFALAGLSALGPSFAAFIVARRQGRLREVFGQFRTHPGWLIAALLTPLCLHLVAKAAQYALGGDVASWFWLPQTSSQIAALVVFSVGEEFGWRGFAHPRLLERYGAVLGPLLTGLIWGIWHLLYVLAPEGSVDPFDLAFLLLHFTVWGPIIAWFFERSQRSLAVAISIHAGGHLDNAAQIAPDDGRMKLLVLLVLAVAAGLAARSLHATWRGVGPAHSAARARVGAPRECQPSRGP